MFENLITNATTITVIMSALLMEIPLAMGAISDYRTRTFPKNIFCTGISGVATLLAALFTIGFYAINIVEGYYFWVAFALAISLVSSMVFYFLGINFGSGGDFRALIYISWICPLLIVETVVISLIIATFQALWIMIKPGDDATPIPFRTIPFAISIFAGFTIVTLYSIWVWQYAFI